MQCVVQELQSREGCILSVKEQPSHMLETDTLVICHTVHLIGMYNIAKQKFMCQGNELAYSQIRNMLGKPRRCRKMRLYYHEAEVMLNQHRVKLFFSRHGKNGKWKVFLNPSQAVLLAGAFSKPKWFSFPPKARKPSHISVMESQRLNIPNSIVTKCILVLNAL